jgi:LPS export ABC transporter protein LptC
MNTIRTFLHLLVLCVLCSLFGCSLDYAQAEITEELSEEIPETVLTDFTHTVVENGRPEFVISADRAENFTERKQTVLFQVTFAEYDSDGSVVTEGVADRAVFFTDTENAELRGNISFYSASEEGRIEAQYLEWNREERRLTSNPADQVLLAKESGSQIRGTGFRADFTLKQIEFSGKAASTESVRGTYVSEEED